MIDNNLFGKVVFGEDKRKDSRRYKKDNEPFFLVFDDGQFRITQLPNGSFDISESYVGDDKTEPNYDFEIYKDILKNAKPVFKRYAVTAPFLSHLDVGRYGQIDVLYELPNGLCVAKMWRENLQRYENDGEMYFVKKDFIERNTSFPQLVKEIEKISLNEVYKDTIKGNVKNDKMSEEQIIGELKNLLISNLEQENGFLRYQLITHVDYQELKSVLNDGKRKCVSKALQFYNEKLKSKYYDENSVEEDVL